METSYYVATVKKCRQKKINIKRFKDVKTTILMENLPDTTLTGSRAIFELVVACL